MASVQRAAVPSITLPRADPTTRRRVRRRVKRRRALTVLLFKSPWIGGFLVFLL
jgi:hypothetical protein